MRGLYTPPQMCKEVKNLSWPYLKLPVSFCPLEPNSRDGFTRQREWWVLVGVCFLYLWPGLIMLVCTLYQRQLSEKEGNLSCDSMLACIYIFRALITTTRSAPCSKTFLSVSSWSRIVFCNSGALAPLTTATNSPPWKVLQGLVRWYAYWWQCHLFLLIPLKQFEC